MNVKILLVLGIMSFVFACKEVKQKERYDSVNIIEYKNMYDGSTWGRGESAVNGISFDNHWV